MRSQYHEQELFVRVVREPLRVRADFHQELLIHEIDERAEVAAVARETIRRPREDAVEFSITHVGEQLLIYRPLSRRLRRMFLRPHIDHI